MSEMPPKKRFKVTDGPVRIRSEANPKGSIVGQLRDGEEIDVEANSRTEAGNFIWWKHGRGWSAERAADGSLVFMQEMVEGQPAPVPPAQPATPAPAPTPPPPAAPAAKKTFRVVDGPINVRESPSTLGKLVGQLLDEDVIEVEGNSRTEAGKFVWWRHSRGWSVERSLDGVQVFMEEPTAGGETGTVTPSPARETITLPDGSVLTLEPFITRLQVNLADTPWIQYFGNTRFAQALPSNRNPWMQKMYYYCQGLHGGIDYGNNNPGILIYAGVNGVVTRKELNSKGYSPNNIRVKVGNHYTLIYGHIVNIRVNEGDTVAPDTIVAEIDPDVQVHLHFEVRYRERYILNPLLFMPPDVRNPFLNKFKNHAKHFYADATWNQWQTPFDQPVLKLMNPKEAEILGPNARP